MWAATDLSSRGENPEPGIYRRCPAMHRMRPFIHYDARHRLSVMAKSEGLPNCTDDTPRTGDLNLANIMLMRKRLAVAPNLKRDQRNEYSR